MEVPTTSEWAQLGEPKDVTDWKDRLLNGKRIDRGEEEMMRINQELSGFFGSFGPFSSSKVPTSSPPKNSVVEQKSEGLSCCQGCKKPAFLQQDPCRHIICTACKRSTCVICATPVESRTVLGIVWDK